VAYSDPARTAPRRIGIRRTSLGLVLVVIAAIVAALGSRSPVSSPSTASSPLPGAAPIDRDRGERRGPFGEADGAVPAGTSVFDDEVPGVAKLDPALLGALRRAAGDAEEQGVRFVVNSGWRSPAYEEQLRREAIAKYGSEAEAARWVATGRTSPHVAGDAVDIGPSDASSWLSAHGAAYGLCRIYGNEPWHYELRPEAAAHGCPGMYADPTQDPRMHR
jgi:zinc D-Ala-D-Ala carboxypeptidase